MTWLITCGKVDKNILFIIIGSMGKFFSRLIKKEFTPIISPHPLMIGINAALGMSLSLIPFIFIKIYSHKPNQKEEYNNNLIIVDSYKEHFREMRCQKYLLIFISCILDYGQKIISFLYAEKSNDNFWVFDLIFVNIFSYFILKTKLYKYQYLSLLIIIILGIILNIINLFDKNNQISIILFIFFIEDLYSLNAVINKYSMEKHFCTPYELSFYEGIFALIINIILLIFTDIDNFSEYIEEIKIKDEFLEEIIKFISLMLSRFVFNLFGIITIKKYTPSHITLILIIGEISFAFWENHNWHLYIKTLICLMILFLLFVFTEIIELNFWGLQNDTKKNILEREELEMKLNDLRESNFSEYDEEDDDERISKLSKNNIGITVY